MAIRFEGTPDQKSKQLEKFIETARALGCDEDKERFEATLGKIAANKPGPPAKRNKGHRTTPHGKTK